MAKTNDPAALIEAIKAADPVALWDALADAAKRADEIRARDAADKAAADKAKADAEQRAMLMDCARLARENREAEEKRKAQDAAITESERMSAIGAKIAALNQPTTGKDAAR